MGYGSNKAPGFLLDDFASCESWSDGINFDLHVVARFGLWDENYEPLNPSDSVTATASLFDVELVLLTLLNWFVEGTFKAHAFHLVCLVQLVLREKTKTPTDCYRTTFASARIPNLRTP